MTVYVLAENTAREGFTPEHGLCLYIETGDKHILFDTGASGVMADHAGKLGLDLSRVDAVVLSHGHYDHGGGLSRFLQCNATAPIYLSTHAFGGYYNGQNRYIGLDPALQACDRLVFTKGRVELFPGVTLCPGGQPKYPVDAAGLQVMDHGQLRPDTFDHEQYLLIREGEKTVCFSGCAHKGVLNIAGWFCPDILVGGFHFKHLEQGDTKITHAARELLALGCTCYTGHCTGQQQYGPMKSIMGPKLHRISTGDGISL